MYISKVSYPYHGTFRQMVKKKPDETKLPGPQLQLQYRYYIYVTQ